MMSFDVQMDYIKLLVWQRRERVNSAEEPVAEVTNILYEQARDYFLDLIKNKYKHAGKVVILGGI